MAYKPPKNVHHSKTLYGVSREKISGWWNGLAYETKHSYEKDLIRLGMDTRRDNYYFATYFFGNLMGATKRAIARLYIEKHGRKK